MNFLLLSSSGQYSCLESLITEIPRRGHTYTHVSDVRPLNNPKELHKLHSVGFDAVIMTDTKFKKFSFCPDCPKSVITSIHHGVGIKFSASYLDSYFNPPTVDVVFVPGQIYFDTLKKNKNRRKDVYVTGFPKTDFLVNNVEKSGEFKTKLIHNFKLNPALPVILYAPTWSRHSYSYGTLAHFEKIYGVLKGFNIIVAPHPSDFSWVKDVLRPKNFPNVGYYLEPNKNSLILGSDVVVSDNSSIAFEAAIIKKPIIHLTNSYAPETMHLYLNQHYPKVQLGDIVLYPQELHLLRSKIEQCLKKPVANNTKKYWTAKFSAGCNGSATQQVLDVIEGRVALRKLKP